MTEGAGQERTIPRVGLRCTIRFQARAAEERLTARSFFCRGVIMGQLGLTVENVRCIQWNQQEKAFDVTLMDLNIFNRVAETCVKEAGVSPLSDYRVVNLDRPNFRVVTVHMYNPFVTDQAVGFFLGNYGEVVAAARRVNDPWGFWTGRRQFQVLLKADPEGAGGLKHPPAFFNIGGDRGFLFYAMQPPFCRRCRRVGHRESDCAGGRCRRCGEGGHEAKDCLIPKACNGCGELGHLYRSCPSRKRTFAEAAGSTGGPEPGGGPSTLGGAAVVEQEERGEPSVPVVGSVELPPFVTTPPIGPKQARRGSQGVEEGHRKRPKGDGVSGEGLNREGEVEGGGELLVGEQGGAAAVVGGCEEVQAEELLPEGLGLGFDLPPGLFLDGDLIGSPTAPNPLPFSWGEQMESVELDP
ncbi:hypothetical protein NHX12_007422 [Muraenolepis orangiensis]|uniref:CCHC-type domain-containing protein n=1 Tax=Muraenolepis orangiensis TaxID=630683 RepID=A0A9Q0DMU7_9TELE|nr:hypothetical protein NHX12_007422 [Muraenolepis orangiensis]